MRSSSKQSSDDLIEDYKSSYRAHFGGEAPKVWKGSHGGFTIVHHDKTRENLSARQIRLYTALNYEMASAVQEENANAH